jgi:hypothetical protein
MSRHDDAPPMRARIPADVDQPDKIAFNLTGRQLLILTAVGLVLYGMWQALLPVLGPLVLLVATIPVAAASLAVALARREGVGFDAWLLAALRHRRADRQMVPATVEQLEPAPEWVATTSGAGSRLPLPAPLRLPARGVESDGVVDLGPDGRVALVACDTVNFGLRSPAEQNGLAAGFARWLNSLATPVQIVVRAHRVDLGHHAARIREGAAALPDPALEQAAEDYAGFLDELATGRELLHRQVTVALRDRASAAHAVGRAADAAQMLAACEVKARLLDGWNASHVLAAAMNPTHPYMVDGA